MSSRTSAFTVHDQRRLAQILIEFTLLRTHRLSSLLFADRVWQNGEKEVNRALDHRSSGHVLIETDKDGSRKDVCTRTFHSFVRSFVGTLRSHDELNHRSSSRCHSISYRFAALSDFLIMHSTFALALELAFATAISDRSMFGRMFNCFQSID